MLKITFSLISLGYIVAQPFEQLSEHGLDFTVNLRALFSIPSRPVHDYCRNCRHIPISLKGVSDLLLLGDNP